MIDKAIHSDDERKSIGATMNSLPKELTELLESTPIDRVITALLRWLASGEPGERARLAIERGGSISVAEIAAMLGAPKEAVECWLARDLAAAMGEPVQARLGPKNVVEYRPAQVGNC